jgi:hypothetical protein
MFVSQASLHVPLAHQRGRLGYEISKNEEDRMARWLVLLMILLILLPAGCSSDKEKGINKDKDKPVPAPKK